MPELCTQKCVPRQGGVPPLSRERTSELLKQLDGWSVENHHHLMKTFRFPDFVQALALVNKIGALAEGESHHPDMCVGGFEVPHGPWTPG